MIEIEKFFREIDRLWESDRENKIPLQVIESGTLLLQTGYNRTTKDGDVLETLEVTPDIKENLTKLAGRGTPLHKRTGLYLDIVLSGLPFLPQEARFHPLRVNSFENVTEKVIGRLSYLFSSSFFFCFFVSL